MKSKRKRKLEVEEGQNSCKPDSKSSSKLVKVRAMDGKETNDVVDDGVYDKNKINKLLQVKEFSVHPVKQINKKKRIKKSNIEMKAIHPALHYLLLWQNCRSEWKFKKVRQMWLLQNMYKKEQVRLFSY